MTARDVKVRTSGAQLDGRLTMFPGATAVVAFAHGSGSSRHSPRNQAVADELHRSGIATLLFDLLTPQEERVDATTARQRFDIDLLTRRLTGAVDWLAAHEDTGGTPIGLFGASTGAAAADEWRQATLHSIESVRSAGVPVVVIGNPPEGKRPADCAVRVAGPDRCTAAMSADTISKRDAERSAVADAVAAGMTAVYVDPDAWFCTAGGSCPVGAGGQIIRIDASHLTAGYSRSLGTLLRSALIAARVVPGAEAR